MENACVLCVDLVLQNRPHPALRHLPVTSGYTCQCQCCLSIVIQKDSRWKLLREEVDQQRNKAITRPSVFSCET